MKKHTEACGCVSTEREWVSMCATDAAEFSERHERAKVDRAASRDRERKERERRELLADLGVSA